MTAAAIGSTGRPLIRLRRAATLAQVQAARKAIKGVGDLSDNIFGVGPFGIGLDGVLAWIPLLGTAYSVGAGAVLLAQGWRAHVSPTRLAAAAAIMSARTLVGEVPLLGDLVVDLVRGHRYSARILQAGIDETLYVEGGRARLSWDPALRAKVDSARATRRRVVFLED